MAYLRPSLGLLSCVSTIALHVAGPNAEKNGHRFPNETHLSYTSGDDVRGGLWVEEDVAGG